MDLTSLKCKACEGWMTPFSSQQIKDHLSKVFGWNLIKDKKIEKDFRFRNFKEALDFVNNVGNIAEKEQHHPDILIYGWNKVKISLTTFALKGLSENDFIMAAKIDAIIL